MELSRRYPILQYVKKSPVPCFSFFSKETDKENPSAPKANEAEANTEGGQDSSSV